MFPTGSCSRRGFIAAAGLSAIPALGIEPFARPGSPRLRLGLAAYSLRRFFQWNRGKEQPPASDPARRLTPESFLDLAADQGWDAAELTSYFFAPAATADDMRDPYAELARCIPYAVNVQYKTEMSRTPGGPKEPADAARVVRLLRDGGYQGFLTLEYEAAEDAFEAVPRQLDKLRALVG